MHMRTKTHDVYTARVVYYNMNIAYVIIGVMGILIYLIIPGHYLLYLVRCARGNIHFIDNWTTFRRVLRMKHEYKKLYR